MRILILGGLGMLGHKLFEVCSASADTWATVREPGAQAPLDRARTVGGVDALSFDSVVRALALVQPDAVVNCIGIVKQAEAARDPLSSIAVNALFPHRLAALCDAAGARLIHISTDCVFSGRQGLRKEEDPPDAEDLYGRSKLLGEIAGPGRLTVRTSMAGRELRTRRGLIEWFLNHRGETVPGYRRAVFSGMTTTALARILTAVLLRHPDLEGLYHVAANPISKLNLLQLVRQEFGAGPEIRPADQTAVDRSLDGSRFRKRTGLEAPDWPAMIRELAREKP